MAHATAAGYIRVMSTTTPRPTNIRWIVFGLASSTSWLLYLHRYAFALIKPKLVEEARALYVRHVMNLWRHCIDGDEIRNPTLSVTATELIDFMLGGR
ncbi:MAG: hypothetical protein JNM18_02325 [Planctomycetaceae bacterium]|nr:hypothetical protein [Planctomycetaceae bacterium]